VLAKTLKHSGNSQVHVDSTLVDPWNLYFGF
jgi:hypothetical protein